jgi:hypothetical protein
MLLATIPGSDDEEVTEIKQKSNKPAAIHHDNGLADFIKAHQKKKK